MRSGAAPMPSRTASSARRSSRRASSRPITSKHAISSTANTQASSSHDFRCAPSVRYGSTAAALADISCTSGSWPCSTLIARRRAFASASSSATACSNDTPGARRATTSSQENWRLPSMSSPANCGFASRHIEIGSHIAGFAAASGPRKPRGSTPITVKRCPLIDTSRPTAAGSPPSASRNHSSLTTATGWPPSVTSSAGPNSRPCCGATPSSVKKLPVARAPSTLRGAAPSIETCSVFQADQAATDAKLFALR